MWILIPLLSSLIGWFTNYLAIKMLFRPKKTISIFGMKIQGIIPKRRGDLALTVGKTIEEELLTHGDLAKALQKVDVREEIRPIIRQKIDEMIEQKLAKDNPMLMALLPPQVLTNIKKNVEDSIIQAAPELINKAVDSFVHKLPIAELVVTNINGFDLDRLEDLIINSARNEFKFIEYLGGVVGLLIGLLQVLLSQLL